MIRDNWHEQYENHIVESRSLEFFTLASIHSEVAKATFSFFSDNEMMYIPVPGTTGAASSPMEPGSDSAPVNIRIGDKTTKLTDSAQFHLEYACRSWNKGCFYYGHSFRDEEPDGRHLSQFSHAEAEILGTLEDVKKLVEKYIKYITKRIWENASSYLKDIPEIEEKIKRLINYDEPFRSISYKKACEVLREYKNTLKECDRESYRITPLGEKILMDKFGEFLWVEHWDKMAVPFYQALDKDGLVALNADLLFGIGEVVGAGQRHCSSDELKDALKEHRLMLDDYQWYVKMKKYYPLQTAGFGMGVERYLMWLLGVRDIRAVELFTRNRAQIGEI